MKTNILLLSLLAPLFIIAQTIRLDSSSLPICIIDTRGKTILNEPRINAHMKVIYNGPGKMNYTNAKTSHYNNFISIEIRGNSSQFYPQKQYGLELRDSTTGEDLDAPLMGMPAEEDWVLYAPYNDISLLRNVMTYHLWNQMGHWGPRTRFCELILNNQYAGVYIMMESIKRGPDRIDIAKLTKEDSSGRDLTGGYIMKIDKKNNTSDLSFISKIKSTDNRDVSWLYHYPDSDEIINSQQNYIKSYIDSLEQSISSPGFADPINGFRKFISVNSFIDYFLLTELTRNIDAYKASSFFYKEKKDADGKKGQFKAGPVWDYNFAYGNASFCSGAQTTGWMYDGCMPATLPTPVMWRRLLQDTNYRNDVKCRYLELRKTLLDTVYLFDYLDSYAKDTLDLPQKRHFSQWKILGTNPGGFNAYIASSYADELRRVKNWIKNRLSWMDANLMGRCILPPNIVKVEVPLDPECFSGTRPLISKNQPFDKVPFNYMGNESISTIPADILRWVIVELRDSNDSSVLVDRRAGLLRSDSSVVDTNFKTGVWFPNVPYGEYYIAVRYDEYSVLLSKTKVKIPNDNDYNLNRPYNLSPINNNSPVLYDLPWYGIDTISLCAGDSFTLNDSSLQKKGYAFADLQISSNWTNINFISSSEMELKFDSSGIFNVELYFSCLDNLQFKSKFTIQAHPRPQAIIYGPTKFCKGDSIRLISDSFGGNTWSTGSTDNFIDVKLPGLYQLTVVNNFGCKDETEIIIEQHPEISGRIGSIKNTVTNSCKLYFIPDADYGPLQYLWSTGEVSDSIEISATAVSLIVRDTNNCRSIFHFTCNPTVTNEVETDPLVIYPNPSRAAFRIKTRPNFSTLQIHSSAGKIIWQKEIITEDQSSQIIEFNNWPAGIYYGSLIYDKHKFNFKFIVL